MVDSNRRRLSVGDPDTTRAESTAGHGVAVDSCVRGKSASKHRTAAGAVFLIDYAVLLCVDLHGGRKMLNLVP